MDYRGQRSPGEQVMPYSNHESDLSNASGVSRREVLCAGGAAAFSSLVAALLGGAERARAEALAGPVPEVDYLAVRVVTDSFQLALAPGMKVGAVEVQRFGMPPQESPCSKSSGFRCTLSPDAAPRAATCCSTSV